MKSSILTVIVATGLMGFALGLLFPVTPFFAQNLGAEIDTVALLFSIYSLCAMISAPFWGRFADKKGRKTTLLIGALGGLLSYLWMAHAVELWELFAARAVAGILSGWMVASQAFISDLSNQQQRTPRLGFLGATFGIGITLGPAASALLIHAFSFPFPHLYLVSSFVVALGFILTLFLPEPHHLKTHPQNLEHTHQKYTPQNLKSFIPRINPQTTTHTAFFLLTALGLSLGFTIIEGIFALWSAQYFSLSPVDVGLILTASGFCAIITQGVLIGIMTKLIGRSYTLMIASSLLTLGALNLALASSIPLLLTGIFLMSTGIALASPPLQSLLINLDPANSATLLGFNHAVSSCARVIGPALGGFTLIHFSSSLPFFISASLGLVSLILWTLLCHPFAQKTLSTSPNTKDAS
jgi:MFS family permease